MEIFMSLLQGSFPHSILQRKGMSHVIPETTLTMHGGDMRFQCQHPSGRTPVQWKTGLCTLYIISSQILLLYVQIPVTLER